MKDSKRRKNHAFLNDEQKLMQQRLLDITCIMGESNICSILRLPHDEEATTMRLTEAEIDAILNDDKGLTANGEAHQAPLAAGRGVPRRPDHEDPMSLVHVPVSHVVADDASCIVASARSRVVGYDGHHAGGLQRKYGVRDLNVPRRRMKQARLAAGMTQYQLAVATGLTITGVANLERGRSRYPRLVTMEAVAAALGVELDWLRDE